MLKRRQNLATPNFLTNLTKLNNDSNIRYDTFPNPQVEAIGAARRIELPELLAIADVISLHCSFTPENHYLVNVDAIAQIKSGVMLINI